MTISTSTQELAYRLSSGRWVSFQPRSFEDLPADLDIPSFLFCFLQREEALNGTKSCIELAFLSFKALKGQPFTINEHTGRSVDNGKQN